MFKVLKVFFEKSLNKYTEICRRNDITNNHSAYYFSEAFHKFQNDGNYQKMHHLICELLFDLAEAGEEIWVQVNQMYREEDELFSRDNVLDENGANDFLEVSILSKTMMEYDQIMFEQINSLYRDAVEFGYRPYFLHFQINKSESDYSSLRFFTNPERLNQWYPGSFNQEWNEEGAMSFSGYIERTASPIIYSGWKLQIKDRLLSPTVVAAINSTYKFNSITCSSDSDVQNELNNILNETDFTKLRVYNVGTGNCLYLYGHKDNERRRLLYDIGYHVSLIPAKKITSTYTPYAMQAIRSMRPSCVILSHWDSDHYKGCAYANNRIFNCRWIAPDCKDASVNAKRLAKYLDLKGNLMLVDRIGARQVGQVHGKTSDLTLWMGDLAAGVKEDNHITKPNRQGIALEWNYKIKKSKEKPINCIMMGDVPYKSLPNAADFANKTPFDYLVVPHHGSFMNVDLLNSATKKEKGISIVCAKKGKNRPHIKHEKALRNGGYTVTLTETADLSIDINLHKKKSITFRN